MRESRASGLRKISGGVLALSVAVMALEWILLVAGVKRDEMIVGALCVIAAVLFLQFVYRAERQKLDIRLKDLATSWRLPWYILTDAWVITLVLLKDLLGIKRASSFYRVCGFKTSKTDPLLSARRVLATAFTTVTPNSIVIGIDYEQSRMLFHQLQRSSVSKMTQELGALPGNQHGREPGGKS
jgi:multisubunit Na+/H+ antiporter MnhE subunit